MPESFNIQSSSGDYSVSVGQGLLSAALEESSDSLIIIDQCLASVLDKKYSNVIYIEAVESAKSLENIAPIITRMRELGVHRKTHLIAIGGGIIQDIATFVASVYMRGITWSYLPTTLLGMVDSCVGGKSSINVGCYKNLVGNFYPPSKILIDLTFLSTLGIEPMVGGLCEAAKICYARDYDEFSQYLADSPSHTMNMEQAENIIIRSLKAKKWFIEIDEFDQRERLLLNFGHTFGHALESSSDFAISHGVAVGIGMLVAKYYALQQGCLDDVGIERVNELTSHTEYLLANVPSLSEKLMSINIDHVLARFDDDKKHRKECYRIVIPKSEGALELEEAPRTDDVRSAIRSAYQTAIDRLCGK